MTRTPQRHVGAVNGGGANAHGITRAVVDGISQAGDNAGAGAGAGAADGRRIRIDALTIRITSDTGMPQLTDAVRREIARALRRVTS